MPANRMRRAAERSLRRDAGRPPALLGPDGARVDPATLLERRGERLWLLTSPGAADADPLAWLSRVARLRAAADPAVAQRPVLVDLPRLAADGPVTTDGVLAAVTGPGARSRSANAKPRRARPGETEHGYLVLLAGLDTAGGAVRAAVAGLPGPLARLAAASTVITLSHAEPVPGFHAPAVVLAAPGAGSGPDADPHALAGEAAWEALAGRLRTQRPWPAGLLSAVVTACTTAPEQLRWRIIDDLAALPDRRLLFQAAMAAGAADDDGVRRAARTEIESLAGTAAGVRDARWLGRLLDVLAVLDAGAHRPDADAPAPDAVLLRMAATGRPGSAPLTLLARRDPGAAIAAAERTADPLDLDAVARAAGDPQVARAVVRRGGVYPPWETALVYRAQLDPAVANALLAEPDPVGGPALAGRWREFPLTRGSALGRLLDDVLARPWVWPAHAAPLLLTLSGARPPASPVPVLAAALPRAGAGAMAAALAVLAAGRLAGPDVTPPLATTAVVAAVAVAGLCVTLRLHQWRAATSVSTAPDAAASPDASAARAPRASGPPTPLRALAASARRRALRRLAGIATGPMDGRPVPFRREHVLAAVAGLGVRPIRRLAPGRFVLDEPLRRACVRAGVPEAEITHLLRLLAARWRLRAAAVPVLPGQAFPPGSESRAPAEG
ncbi:hypothetical protein AB0M46_31640 [Dactylosporangium sp. NPDC051485]|uniref:hypothetical protein n=1 Tax=Dactylosporangium sp. NPDC051485 TaxID=3154846 RepID=UPI003414646A